MRQGVPRFSPRALGFSRVCIFRAWIARRCCGGSASPSWAASYEVSVGSSFWRDPRCGFLKDAKKTPTHFMLLFGFWGGPPKTGAHIFGLFLEDIKVRAWNRLFAFDLHLGADFDHGRIMRPAKATSDFRVDQI